MGNANSSMTVTNLELTVDDVFDVTITHRRTTGGFIVLHTDTARITLSPAVMAQIDQARAEAGADRETDITKQAGA